MRERTGILGVLAIVALLVAAAISAAGCCSHPAPEELQAILDEASTIGSLAVSRPDASKEQRAKIAADVAKLRARVQDLGEGK